MENEKKRRASSILKPQKPRKPLCEVTTTSKRVSFRRHSSVKQYMKEEQPNTLCDSTFEEPVNDSTTPINSRDSMNISIAFDNKDLTGVVQFEHSHTNFRDPDILVDGNTSIDKSHTNEFNLIKDLTLGAQSFDVCDVNEINSVMEFTCQNVEEVILDKTNLNVDESNLELTCRIPQKIFENTTHLRQLNDIKDKGATLNQTTGLEMEFTCQFQPIIFEKPPVLSTQPNTILDPFPPYINANNKENDQNYISKYISQNLKETVEDMEFTCRIPPTTNDKENNRNYHKENIDNSMLLHSTNVDMEFTCLTGIVPQNNKRVSQNLNKTADVDMEFTCRVPASSSKNLKHVSQNLKHAVDESNMEFTCQIPPNISSSCFYDKENDPNHKENSMSSHTNNVDMEFTCQLPGNVAQNIKHVSQNLEETIGEDMEFTCQIPTTISKNLKHSLQTSKKGTSRTTSCSSVDDKENYPIQLEQSIENSMLPRKTNVDMEFTCQLPGIASQNIEQTFQNLHKTAGEDMEFTCQIPTNISKNLKHSLQTSKKATSSTISCSSLNDKENYPIQFEQSIENSMLPQKTNVDMEFTCQIPGIASQNIEQPSQNLNKTAGEDMEFTCQIPTNTSKNLKHSLQTSKKATSRTTSCSSIYDKENYPIQLEQSIETSMLARKTNVDMEFTCQLPGIASQNIEQFSQNLYKTGGEDMEFTCQIPTNISKNLKHSLQTSKKATSRTSSCSSINDKENYPIQFEESVENSMLPRKTNVDMEFTCQIPGIASQNIKQTSQNLNKTAGEDMEFTCQIPTNISKNLKHSLQTSEKATSRTTSCSSVDDKENYPIQLEQSIENYMLPQKTNDDMEFTSQLPGIASQNIEHALQNLKETAAKDMEFIPTIISKNLDLQKQTLKKTASTTISSSSANDKENKPIQLKENIENSTLSHSTNVDTKFTNHLPRIASQNIKHVSQNLKEYVGEDMELACQIPINTPKNFKQNLQISTKAVPSTSSCSFADDKENNPIHLKESIDNSMLLHNTNVDMELTSQLPRVVPQNIEQASQNSKETCLVPNLQTSMTKKHSLTSSLMKNEMNNGEEETNTCKAQLSQFSVSHDCTEHDVEQVTFDECRGKIGSLSDCKGSQLTSKEDITYNNENITMRNESVFLLNGPIKPIENPPSRFCSYNTEELLQYSHINLSDITTNLEENKTYIVDRKSIENISVNAENCEKNISQESFNLAESLILYERLNLSCDKEDSPKAIKLKPATTINWDYKKKFERFNRIKELRQSNLYLMKDIKHDLSLLSEQCEKKLLEKLNEKAVEKEKVASLLNSEQIIVSENLPEKVRKAELRASKVWTFKSQTDDVCYFNTLYETLEFAVKCTADPCLVEEITITNEVPDTTTFLRKYIWKLCTESLRKETVTSALGVKYDILSLLDYVYSKVTKLLQFEDDINDLQFSNCLEYAENNRFRFKIMIASKCIWWNFEVEARDFKNILPGDIKIEKKYGKCNVKAIKNLVFNCRTGWTFLKSYVDEINNYVETSH